MNEFTKIVLSTFGPFIGHHQGLQILEALHIKTKKPRINKINFENSDNVLKGLESFFFFFKHSIFLDNILFPLIAFCFFLNSSASQFYLTLHLYNLKKKKKITHNP